MWVEGQGRRGGGIRGSPLPDVWDVSSPVHEDVVPVLLLSQNTDAPDTVQELGPVVVGVDDLDDDTGGGGQRGLPIV